MLDTLSVNRFDLLFRARADDRVRDDAFAENLWRGGFGHALRHRACLAGAAGCRSCRTEACLYSYIFETPPPADAQVMRLYPHVPHPYVLRVVGHDPSDASVRLRLTLIGERASAALPLVLLALHDAGAGHHGIGGQLFDLHGVLQEPMLGTGEPWPSIDTPAQGWNPLPAVRPVVPAAPVAGELRIGLDSPLKVKRDGRPVTADRALRFADFFGALLRRISMLMAFHGTARLEADFQGLTARATRVEWLQARVEPALRTRYSNRQRAAMRLEGVTGCFVLSAADAEPFWPYLWLGQFVHNGGAATMGFGCYRIEARPVLSEGNAASLRHAESAPG